MRRRTGNQSDFGKKKPMSYNKLEKMLFDTLNAKEVLTDIYEKFLLFYDELDHLLS